MKDEDGGFWITNHQQPQTGSGATLYKRDDKISWALLMNKSNKPGPGMSCTYVLKIDKRLFTLSVNEFKWRLKRPFLIKRSRNFRDSQEQKAKINVSEFSLILMF